MKSNYEKIIVRDDKSKVMIEVRIDSSSFRNEFNYDIRVAQKGFRKKTWVYVNSGDMPQFITPMEIYEAKIEAWQNIKPIFQDLKK